MSVIIFALWAIYLDRGLQPSSKHQSRQHRSRSLRRFVLRQAASQPIFKANHQIKTTGEGSINFGHGPHVCLGQFFAIFKIKSLLVSIIRYYDIRLKNGRQPVFINV
ncbi:hypothetical protein F4678DRAFT_466306 [Xylaria arbuscula]|nr:hypothetical protein F4678DRAFT_466306 [Xylaria arbuscula]